MYLFCAWKSIPINEGWGVCGRPSCKSPDSKTWEGPMQVCCWVCYSKSMHNIICCVTCSSLPFAAFLQVVSMFQQYFTTSLDWKDTSSWVLHNMRLAMLQTMKMISSHFLSHLSYVSGNNQESEENQISVLVKCNSRNTSLVLRRGSETQLRTLTRDQFTYITQHLLTFQHSSHQSEILSQDLESLS